MGDRANVWVRQNEQDTGVYLYTHWEGSSLPFILQEALKRGQSRWYDCAYLTRIVFSEMVKDDLMSETGYGISAFLNDNEHHIIEVRCDNATVKIADKVWTIQEYVKKTRKSILKEYGA